MSNRGHPTTGQRERDQWGQQDECVLSRACRLRLHQLLGCDPATREETVGVSGQDDIGFIF
jgi:hypothetical protein